MAVAVLNTSAQITGKTLDLTENFAFASYTPTWTNAGTANSLGNGVLTGGYFQVGKLVVVRFSLVFGTTTTSGNGAWKFALPVTAATLSGTLDGAGHAIITDASAGQYGVVVGLLNTTQFTPFNTDALTAGVTATVPMTWTSTDNISGYLFYQAP